MSKYQWALTAAVLFLACAVVGSAGAESIKYLYNSDGSIQKAIYSTKAITYQYDASGNRTSQAIATVTPSISANPTSLTFDPLNVGSVSAAKTVTLTNTGAAPLSIQGITLAGGNSAEFAKQADTCSGQTLLAGNTCTAGAVFQPAAPAGAKTATLTVSSNASGNPTLNIPLSGTAQCSAAISPASAAYNYNAASGTVTVTTQTGCLWEAQSGAGWLTFTNGTGRSGSGSVSYTVAQNPSASPRSITAAIAGQNFTVDQTAAPCTYTVAPLSVRFAIGASTVPITITANSGSCGWTVSNLPGWITATSTSGNGTTTVNLAATANTGTTQRTATIGIAGQSVTVIQSSPMDIDKIGTFSSGTWTLDVNGDGAYAAGADRSNVYGQAGDIVVYGDWNGDGRTKIGVYQPSTGYWYLDYKGTGVWVGCGAPADPTKDMCIPGYGGGSWKPVVGDWSGNGKTKIGIYLDGTWYLDYKGTGAFTACGAPADPTKDMCITGYGGPSWTPVIGDWSGNGKAKVGIYYNGYWYLDYKGTGTFTECGAPTDPTKDMCSSGYGGAEWTPVVGDWNGDGKKKIGVYYNGTWQLDYKGTGVFTACGAPTDPTKDMCVTGYGGGVWAPVVGDWSGDGKTKIGIHYNGYWYLDYKGQGAFTACGAPADPTKDACYTFGSGGSPIVGKW